MALIMLRMKANWMKAYEPCQKSSLIETINMQKNGKHHKLRYQTTSLLVLHHTTPSGKSKEWRIGRVGPSG